MFWEYNSTSKILLIDYTLRKATSFTPYEISRIRIMADAFYGRRRMDDVLRYLKKKNSETKYNSGYNSHLGVRHFAVSAVGVGQVAAMSDVYLIFKHFEFIKHCFMS